MSYMSEFIRVRKIYAHLSRTHWCITAERFEAMVGDTAFSPWIYQSNRRGPIFQFGRKQEPCSVPPAPLMGRTQFAPQHGTAELKNDRQVYVDQYDAELTSTNLSPSTKPMIRFFKPSSPLPT